MASGDFLYNDACYIDVELAWDAGICCSAQNGLIYFYDDGIGGSYSGFSGYLNCGCVFFNQLNLGYPPFSDDVGVYCCVAQSNGLGGYFWSTTYIGGTILNSGSTYLCIKNQSINNGILCCVSLGTPFSYGATQYYYESSFCISGEILLSGSYNDVTGCNFYTAYSDGTGSYYSNTLYCSGVYLQCNPISITVLTENFNNGYLYCISDGTGSCYTSISYCEYDYEFLYSGKRSYRSNNCSGYFIFRDPLLNNVSIGWDFSDTTRSKYFNSLNSSICLNNNLNFYEFSSQEDLVISVSEVDQNCFLNLYAIKNPFIFVRNLGPSNVCLISSNEDLFYEFQTGKNTLKECHSNIDYNLNSGEGLFLYINTSADGSKYFSESCYPYGFFYEFKNVNLYNEFGEFPACCNTGSCALYIYECLLDYPLGNCSDNCYSLIKSYGFNSIVDRGTDLEIKNSKYVYDESTLFCSSLISQDYNFTTCYGSDMAFSLIKTNCIDLLINGEKVCNLTSIRDLNFNKTIQSDLDIKIIYDVEVNYSYQYNYLYCFSGDCESSTHRLFSTSGAVEISGSQCLIPETLYSIYSSSPSDYYICVDPNDCYSIKSINVRSISRDDLYLPTKNNFNYSSYCYPLNISSALLSYPTGDFPTGFWNCCIVDDSEYFVNSINLVNCLDQSFIDNQSQIYSINIDYSESRISSETVTQASSTNSGEEFSLFFDNVESEFIYSGITFKYNPATCILYNGNRYEIPDVYVDYTADLSGKQSIFQFPIRAVNKDKIKIISNFENFEIVDYSSACINYSGINFCLTCQASNCITFNIPKINCVSGVESPSAILTLHKRNLVQQNLNIYLNPLFTTSYDVGYGLNDFLLFLNSELNCGLVHYENYSLICYGDSDYNFLMLDLKSEISANNFLTPTGCWQLIDNKITFAQSCLTTFFPVKSKFDNGYNYIINVVTGFCYSDSFCDFSGQSQQVIIDNKNLNVFTYAQNYYAGEYIIDQTGTGIYTGICTGLLNTSLFCYTDDLLRIDYTKAALSGTQAGRCLSFQKSSTYSGIQPILIQSNYQLLDIKFPITYPNLVLYCDAIRQNAICDIFYYLYDINNFVQRNIKISSPEGTVVDYVCWKDNVADNNYLCYLDYGFNKGNINKNAALLVADINPNKNNYCYDPGSDYSICINIIGDI